MVGHMEGKTIDSGGKKDDPPQVPSDRWSSVGSLSPEVREFA